jgi:vacuolar-type H+-ATPase subunit C/Vma6
MRAPDVALVARARGIAIHFLTRPVLDAVAGAVDLAGLERDIRRLGCDLDPIGENIDIAAVDRAIGRTAQRHVRTLARWQTRAGVLDVFVASLDRRALRALIRGAVQGAPPGARLDGLLPTPLLPERVLVDLAREASAAAVVKTLVRLRYPGAADLLPMVSQAQPDLLPIEAALLRGFAARARAAAAQNDRYLRQYVSELVDSGNLHNALLVAGSPHDLTADTYFIGGGRWLSREAFVVAAGSTSRDAAAASLRAALLASPLASLPLIAGDAAGLERAFLVDALRRYSGAARREPLSSALLLAVLLRLDVQSRDLRTIAWGAVFDAPPGRRRQELMTSP